MRLKRVLKRKGYTRITLKKTKTNHFEVKLKINGIKGRFIVDTGASNSCVGIDCAEKFKMNFEDSQTKAAGAGTVDIETKISTNNKIKIAEWKHYSFRFILINLEHINQALTNHKAKAVDGIIGADVLEKGKAIIDYKNKKMYLKKLVYKF